MKRNIFIIALFLLSFSLISVSNVSAQEQELDWEMLIKQTNWKLFSDNLVKAVNSGNLGLQTSAMQLIVQWHDRLKVENATPALIKLYRNHENERVRMLALVTINKINNEWAKGIVNRDVAFEKSKTIKRMMYAILSVQPERELAVVNK